MKFLIQTVNDEIVHDFSFQLKEAIRYRNWYYNSDIDIIEYTNSIISKYKEWYHPVFKDVTQVSIDLCQECLYELIKDFYKGS